LIEQDGRKKMKYVLPVLVFAAFTVAFPRQQVLDRVVAVVGNDVILASDLKAAVQIYAMNNRIDASTPGLDDQVLQGLINEKLIVAKAVEDSVTVTDEEVQQQLDAVIQMRVQQFGSEQKMEDAYGMPISRIKREFRDEMRKNLLAQKLQQQRISSTTVGRYEVEEFYSLPRVPEELEMSDIVIAPNFDPEARAAAYKKLTAIRDSIRAGGDFADFAKRYSEDPGSAPRGGDLGFARRGTFVNEFETAVFGLAEGQLSDIVESQFGLHLIQLLERRGDAVHARHILLRIPRSDKGDQAAIAKLDSLRLRALAGESFAELARKYSEGKESVIGGNMGTAEIDQVNKDILPAVEGLKPGDISKPVKVNEGSGYRYHIVLLRSRTPAHEMSLDKDYHKLEQIALKFKQSKEYQAWVDDLRNSIYWQSRLAQ
jgi:peptidyl-prolyl cis-trans isomerase SurA